MCRFMGGMMVKRMPPRYGSSMLSRVRDARPPESSGNKEGIMLTMLANGTTRWLDSHGRQPQMRSRINFRMIEERSTENKTA
jgi:hypothetical protein